MDVDKPSIWNGLLRAWRYVPGLADTADSVVTDYPYTRRKSWLTLVGCIRNVDGAASRIDWRLQQGVGIISIVGEDEGADLDGVLEAAVSLWTCGGITDSLLRSLTRVRLESPPRGLD